MKTHKIAITIPDDILKSIDQLSKSMKVSRSKILSEGAKDIVKKMQRKKIVDAYKHVFADPKVQKEQLDMANAYLKMSKFDKNEY